MVGHVDRRHHQVAPGATKVTIETGTNCIGVRLNHETQGYPFVASPRLVKGLDTNSVAVLLIAALALLAGCVSDDDPTAGSGITISTQPTVPEESEQDPTTTVGETEEPDTTTVPEQLPEPAWAGTEFVLQPVVETASGLAMSVHPGDESIWLAEREGRVRRVEQSVSSDDDQDAEATLSDPVLDISDKVGTDGEGGLLGLDFSADGRHLYLSYTDTDGNSVIAEYEVDETDADSASERVVLQVEQPYSNHNGGQITVGPDGFLYVAFGDGGSGGG